MVCIWKCTRVFQVGLIHSHEQTFVIYLKKPTVNQLKKLGGGYPGKAPANQILEAAPWRRNELSALLGGALCVAAMPCVFSRVVGCGSPRCRTSENPYKGVYIYIYTRACMHVCVHACIHTYSHTVIHTVIHTDTYIQTHTYRHIHTDTYITLHYITYIHTIPYIHYIHYIPLHTITYHYIPLHTITYIHT